MLVDLADAPGRNITMTVSPKSDLATMSFAEDFSGRLLAYHAFHEQKLTKKTFEFGFCAVSHAAGRKASITVSKLMEARWIRECRKPEDFTREVTTRVVEHLNEYERIVTLRAFERPKYLEYDLIEIPLEVRRSVGSPAAGDFSQRTPNGGSSARVTCSGETASTLRLDDSVEKITVSGLRTSLCVHHATWRVNRS